MANANAATAATVVPASLRRRRIANRMSFTAFIASSATIGMVDVPLVGSQGDDRIDARRASCRDPACDDCDEHEQRDDSDERQRVAWCDAI